MNRLDNDCSDSCYKKGQDKGNELISKDSGYKIVGRDKALPEVFFLCKTVLQWKQCIKG